MYLYFCLCLWLSSSDRFIGRIIKLMEVNNLTPLIDITHQITFCRVAQIHTSPRTSLMSLSSKLPQRQKFSLKNVLPFCWRGNKMCLVFVLISICLISCECVSCCMFIGFGISLNFPRGPSAHISFWVSEFYLTLCKGTLCFDDITLQLYC